MKPVIVFVATFVVAMGASTGAKVVMTKPGSMRAPGDSTHAASDSTQTDSTKKENVEGAVKQAVEPARSAVPLAAVDSAARDSSAKLAAAAHGPEPRLLAGGSKGVARPGAPGDTASERRIAKVFTSMDAKQAAKVLEHMADSDVEIILGYVGPRQAASILAALPPERVATLSKIAMQGKSK
jgi:flagellar motility protein MotE (MotC chaperone)